MEIQINGKVGRSIPRAHVGARLRRALSRLPVDPVTARVTFADVNGPKGGNDIRCAVLIELPRQPSIRVERLASNREIAAELGVAEKTVKVHRSRMMEKLGIRTVADLVRMAEKLEVSK